MAKKEKRPVLPDLPPLKITPREEAESWVRIFAHYYEEEQNPVYVWLAWKHISEFNIELPDWVASYFDKCSQGVQALRKPKASRNAGDIAKAMGFICKQGNDGSLAEAEIRLRDQFLGLAVSKRVSKGEHPTYAADFVADEYKTSPSTAYRAFKRLGEESE